MIGLTESSKRMYYNIDVSFNRYLALKSEIEREYNNTIKILDVYINDVNYNDDWTTEKRQAKEAQKKDSDSTL